MSVPRIRFRCLGPECNACCKSPADMATAVRLGPRDIERLGEDFERAKATPASGGAAIIYLPPNALCPLWEEGVGCSVYARRPLQCRTFPIWPAILFDPEVYALHEKHCPGLGQGHVIPLTKIRATLRSARRAA